MPKQRLIVANTTTTTKKMLPPVNYCRGGDNQQTSLSSGERKYRFDVENLKQININCGSETTPRSVQEWDETTSEDAANHIELLTHQYEHTNIVDQVMERGYDTEQKRKEKIKYEKEQNKVKSTNVDYLLEQYHFPIFLFSQFNVHYMSWIKNKEHLHEYMDRFTCLYDLVVGLPEFWSDPNMIVDNGSGEITCSDTVEEEKNDTPKDSWKDLIITAGINEALRYRRKLIISLRNVNGIRYYMSNKKLRIMLTTNYKGNNSEGVNAISNVSEKDEQEEEYVDENDKEEFENVEHSNDEVYPNTNINNFQNLEKDSKECIDNQQTLDECELIQSGISLGHELKMDDMEFLGEIQLVEGASYEVTLPLYTNRIWNDIYFYLAMVDDTDQLIDGDEAVVTSNHQSDERQHRHCYFQIIISEAIISGNVGFVKRFKVVLDNGTEQNSNVEKQMIEFELTLRWKVDRTCFPMVVTNPIPLLEKLSGAMFHLGHYYWHFFEQFYQWAATEAEDVNVRYVAIQIFQELAMLLPPKMSLANIFTEMYHNHQYPSYDQLIPAIHGNGDQDVHYVLEPVSILDNIVYTFFHITTEEQLYFIGRLKPSITLLLKCRLKYTNRLLSMIRHSLGNYPTDQLEQIVLPMVLELILFISSLENGVDLDTHGFYDPRATSKISWEQLTTIGTLLVSLVVDCVDCAKPQSWMIRNVGDPEMAPIERMLQHIIEQLFNECGIRFLKVIYCRIQAQKSLKNHHLEPFITGERIEQYQKWFESRGSGGTSGIIVNDDTNNEKESSSYEYDNTNNTTTTTTTSTKDDCEDSTTGATLDTTTATSYITDDTDYTSVDTEDDDVDDEYEYEDDEDEDEDEDDSYDDEEEENDMDTSN